MNRLIIIALLLLTTSPAFGFGRRNRGYSHQSTSIPAGCSNATAQGVAEIMARCERVDHWGGNPSYEGCGSGASQAAAYGICCYSTMPWKTVDVGYAQGKSGMWYCCRRYQP